MTTTQTVAAPWHEAQLELNAEASYASPYTHVEVWADFTCGEHVLRRPAFWVGGDRWCVRFAHRTPASGAGSQRRVSTTQGWRVARGSVRCRPGPPSRTGRGYAHGFWRMSPSGRQLVHADGTPALMVADTAWALPWRATPAQVEERQPTDIHYRPHATNRAHPDAEWLDFQACQTGHEAEHLPERVADMWRNTPAKGVLNLEPTYENTHETGRAAGWWQGHEAWSNLCAGATMGLGDGAAGLWQWRLHADEPGHPEFFLGPHAGWRDALSYEGSSYVGHLGRILRDLPFLNIAPDWTSSLGGRGLSVPGELLLLYRDGARVVKLIDTDVPRHLTVIDPRSGEVLQQTLLDPVPEVLENPCGEPRIYVFTDQPVDRDQLPSRTSARGSEPESAYVG